MNGKNTFTSSEIEKLRGLIRTLHDLPKDKHKGVRNTMRRMGFYITDFVSTITPEIFEGLIRSGAIRVVEGVTSNACKPSTAKSEQTQNKACTNYDEGFPPIIDEDSEILILGTCPGKESIKMGEYYAHGRNAVWRIISDVFNGGVAFSSYEEKLKCLHENHIALWDSMHSCVRKGSLDADIKDYEKNDIKGLLASHPKIKRVICNGKKSADSIQKGVEYICAGSTSPAHTIPYEEKLAEWSKLLK